MDIILIILILILFFCIIFLCFKTEAWINKNRSTVYIILVLIILLLLLSIYFISINNKKQLSQNGGFTSFSKRNMLMDKCGLPQNYSSTNHCFSDSTHHTCCLLGPKARKYADSSGNPIGKASKKAFKQKYKRSATQGDLTPWCTCFGSEVCSFYSDKFDDGTKIKFVNNPKSETQIQENVSPECEGYYRQKFEVQSHGTPGVNKMKRTKLGRKCEAKY